MWGTLKNWIYAEPIQDIDQLPNRISNAFTSLRKRDIQVAQQKEYIFVSQNGRHFVIVTVRVISVIFIVILYSVTVM